MDKQIGKKTIVPSYTVQDIIDYFCPHATVKEAKFAFQICKINNLNPFKKDVHLVKYSADDPMSIVVNYTLYLARAEETGEYRGFRCWVENPDDESERKACIDVYRKGWENPLHHEVKYKEYVRKTKTGELTRFWKNWESQLKKVAISQGIRFAFPSVTKGLPYTKEEMGIEIDMGGNGDVPREVKSKPEVDIPQALEKPVVKGESKTKDIISLARRVWKDEKSFIDYLGSYGVENVKELTAQQQIEVVGDLTQRLNGGDSTR